MLKDKDRLLNEETRSTNLEFPYSDYVNGDTFPEQNMDLLNTKVYITYRDYYYEHFNEIYRKSSGRPEDDKQMKEDYPDYKTWEDESTKTESFRVVRADNAEPYLLIGVNYDYSRIIINSSKPTDNGYEYKNRVSSYVVQNPNYICIDVEDLYPGNINKISGKVLSIDQGEPSRSIIVEYLEDNIIRFTLSDEHESILYNYNTRSVLDEDTIMKYRKEAIEGYTLYGEV